MPPSPSILGRILAALMALLAATAAPRAAADEAPLEYRVKAALVYNFVQFTDWPASAVDAPGEAIVVGLVGDDVYRGALEKSLADKTVRQHPLVYRHFASAEAIGPCDVLVVSPSESARLWRVLEKVAARPVLTISDIPQFTADGGMVRLYLEEGKPRFEVRLRAVERQGLKMSSRLLKVAKIIEE